MSTIHIFKPSGKWYTSGTIDMRPFDRELIHVALFMACEAAHSKDVDGVEWPMSCSPRNLLTREDDHGWSIVCVDPEHPHAHPLMLKSLPL